MQSRITQRTTVYRDRVVLWVVRDNCCLIVFTHMRLSCPPTRVHLRAHVWGVDEPQKCAVLLSFSLLHSETSTITIQKPVCVCVCVHTHCLLRLSARPLCVTSLPTLTRVFSQRLFNLQSFTNDVLTAPECQSYFCRHMVGRAFHELTTEEAGRARTYTHTQTRTRRAEIVSYADS